MVVLFFYAFFGFSSLAGGFAHAFFYYWGPEGKSICWISSLIAIYFIERAMISCLTEKKWKSTFLFFVQQLNLFFYLFIWDGC